MIFHSSLDWSTPAVDLPNLKPGETRTVTVTVSNDNDVPISLTEMTTTKGALFAGNNPVNVKLDVRPQDPCVTDGSIIPPGQKANIDVTAGFPYVSGNEYQGATGIVTVQLTASEYSKPCALVPSGGNPGKLTITGFDTGLVLLVAVVALAAGVGLLQLTRRSRRAAA